MSFGFSVGDFIALGSLAWNLYKECKNTSAQFQEVQNEVLSLRTAIQELQDEAENNDSILNRAGLGRKKELDVIMRNCTEVLKELKQLLTRYKSLGTNQKRTWDRIKFSSEGVQEIRDKLMFHSSALMLFLTSLGTGSLGRIEKKLDDLAADIRAGHHEPSIITSCDEDNSLEDQEQAWRLLTRELSEDFTREEIEVHKIEIKRYIRKLIERGDFEEKAPIPNLIDLSDHELSSDDSTVLHAIHKPGKHFVKKALPSPTRWPPQPFVESDRETASPPLTERFSNNVTISKSGNGDEDAGHSNNEETYSSDDSSQPEVPSMKKGPVNTIDDLFLPHNSIEISPIKCAYIGIDINSDYCRVAACSSMNSEQLTPSHVSRSDAFVLSNEHGNSSTPTYIAFTPDDILIGEDAKNQASRNAENTFFGFTLLLGSFYDAPVTRSLQKYSGFQINDLNGKPNFFAPCRQKHYSPEELTAFLIKKMVRVVELTLRQSVSHVFISARSTLTLFGIEAFHTAAALAKVGLERTLNSATAAIYGHIAQPYQGITRENDAERIILVINVCVDGYECSLVNAIHMNGDTTGDIIDVKGTSGYFNLSLDFHLYELLYSNFHANHPGVTTISPSPRQWTRLAKAVEEARQQLISATEAEILLDSYHDGIDLKAKIRSEDLQLVVRQFLMPALLSCLESLLVKTKIAKVEIAEVIIIGEMARLPVIREEIKFWPDLGSKVANAINPVEGAVLGLAMHHNDVYGCRFATDVLLFDCWNSELYIATHPPESDAEHTTCIVGLGTKILAINGLDLFTLRSAQGGVLLRFYNIRPFDDKCLRLLFEVAVSLPDESRQSSHRDRLNLGVQIDRDSSLRITLGNDKTRILDLVRSPMGLLSVKRGLCVPISPLIRETWRVTTEKHKEAQAPVVPAPDKRQSASRSRPPRPAYADSFRNSSLDGYRRPQHTSKKYQFVSDDDRPKIRSGYTPKKYQFVGDDN